MKNEIYVYTLWYKRQMLQFPFWDNISKFIYVHVYVHVIKYVKCKTYS